MYLIGLDGGGTKTEAVLCDFQGRALRRHVTGATNPNGQTREAARAALTEALQTAAGGEEIASAFAGVAGAGAKDMRALYGRWMREALPGARRTANSSDVACAATSVLGREDGIAAIAGTGSSAFARVGGEYHQVGGWGYFFEDAGSGFEFGRQALIHWMRSSDGREEPGELARLCREEAGGEALEVLTELYRQGRTRIAAFAPCAFAAARAGDPVAREIIRGQARLYADLLLAGGRIVAARPVQVALAGSIWKQESFLAAVREFAGPDFSLRGTDLPPVFGAVREAGYAAGLDCGEAFTDNFRATYSRL